MDRIQRQQYLLILFVMFLNLLTAVYFSFQTTYLALVALAVLALFNVLWLLNSQRTIYAMLFLSTALLNTTFLLILSHETIAAPLAIINLILLYQISVTSRQIMPAQSRRY